MQQFYYAFGAQMFCELERPDIVIKPGSNVKVAGEKYTLLIKPSSTKVVIKI